MSKKDFTIDLITKHEASEVLSKFHYLTSLSRGFKSGINFGLFDKEGSLRGVCIFTGFPVPELSKGLFGLDRKDQEGLYELSRLCMHPKTQEEEYNITSWFVARCIRELRKQEKVRALLSYADTDYHNGIIYRALSFDYYGLTDPKKDFYIKQANGSYLKHSRGKIKGLEGEWRDRTRKHRYLKVFDKQLKPKWERVEWQM